MLTMLIEQFQKLEKEIVQAKKRHRSHYGAQVRELVSQVEIEYIKEVSYVLDFLVKDRHLNEIIDSGKKILETIFISNRWVGWELCDLGPPLNIWPVEEFPIAMIAYVAIHLVDDGIDGHLEYKALGKQSYYGYLIENHLNNRQASAISAMLGMAVFNASVRRLNKKNIRSASDILLRLSSNVFVGMMAEAFSHSRVSLESYKEIIRRKSIAYQMILDHVFLTNVSIQIRSVLLELNARLVEIGQLTDDLIDEEDDLSMGRFNILMVPDMNRTKVLQMILVSLQELWQECRSLTAELRDVMAVRMADWVRLGIEEAKK